MSLKEVSSSKCFGGYQKVFSHPSDSTNSTMKFSIYIPPCADSQKVPVLYFLAGMSDNEQTLAIKTGFQLYAARYKLCVVSPDTSPRDTGIEGENDAWNYGSGAGYYVDATEEKWKKHYQMYTYVTKELPALIESSFSFVVPQKCSISGFSMGGGGALTLALKNPGKYMVCTVFAPAANVTRGKIARKALIFYMGDNPEAWKQWDPTELVASYKGPSLHLLIDQGTNDMFQNELLVDNFVKACSDANIPVEYRPQKEYDHSYFFVATFLEDHFKRHSEILYS